MKRKIFVFTLMILTLKLFGQDILFEKDIKLISVLKDKRESLPVVNQFKSELALFLLDNQKINCLLFNKDYELTDEFTTIRPGRKFSVLLGYSITRNRYHLFFTNNNKKQFYIESINIPGKNSQGKQTNIKLRSERFLESISYKGKFYILTIKDLSSVLKLYVFEGDTLSQTGQFDFSSYKFSNTDYYKLSDVFNGGTSVYRATPKINKIDISNPNPLDLTVNENKVYYFGDKLYLTLDNDKNNTKLITIDLKDLSSEIKFFDQIKTGCGNTLNTKSNSYVYSNYLYQVKACSNELAFRITNITNDSIMKEYRVKSDEEITFKNSPLMQEGGRSIFAQGKEKELDKTKQVLRKICADDIGISVRPLTENVEITIGGVMEVQVGGRGATMPMSSAGPSFSAPYGTVTTAPVYHYNPSMYGYNMYTLTRAVYFKSLMDKITFDHVEGKAPDNVYDKIKDFENGLNNKMKDILFNGDLNNATSETIFKVDNYYVLGYYNKYKHEYYLLKFTN